jgi:hypothetical protein
MIYSAKNHRRFTTGKPRAVARCGALRNPGHWRTELVRQTGVIGSHVRYFAVNKAASRRLTAPMLTRGRHDSRFVFAWAAGFTSNFRPTIEAAGVHVFRFRLECLAAGQLNLASDYRQVCVLVAPRDRRTPNMRTIPGGTSGTSMTHRSGLMSMEGRQRRNFLAIASVM